MVTEFDNKTPIYIQIMDKIKQDIISGKLQGGGKLPSVRSLSAELKVNPNTIQRAYQELEREELTFTQRGMGTFVTEDDEKIFTLKKGMAGRLLSDFIEGMKGLGFKGEDILQMISEELKKEGH